MKEFMKYFNKHYSYIGPNLTDREIEAFLAQEYIKKLPIAEQAFLFADYLLANGLAEVQE